MFLRYWPSPLSFAGDLIGVAGVFVILIGGQAIAWGLQ